MNKLRNDLIDSINKCVDREQFLDADRIADEILNDFLSDEHSLLITQVETAHDALNAVYASGQSNEYTDDMINRGIDGKPQLESTKVG